MEVSRKHMLFAVNNLKSSCIFSEDVLKFITAIKLQANTYSVKEHLARGTPLAIQKYSNCATKYETLLNYIWAMTCDGSGRGVIRPVTC